MHYHCELWLPEVPESRAELEQVIEPIMLPYSEHIDKNKTAFWDWYQIGGRWTGEHDKYDPYMDIKNQEICNLCNGTGTRPDHLACDDNRGCNACQGTGMKIKNDLIPHDEDVIRLEDVRDDLDCNTLVVPLPKLKKAKVFHKEIWNGGHLCSQQVYRR